MNDDAAVLKVGLVVKVRRGVEVDVGGRVLAVVCEKGKSARERKRGARRRTVVPVFAVVAVVVLVVREGRRSVLARQIANLARLGCGGIARRNFTADEGIEVLASRVAVAVLGDGVDVDVVGCCWCKIGYVIQRERKGCARNGPPFFGKPQKWTSNLTPLPPGPATAEMDPRTVSRRSGKVAV